MHSQMSSALAERGNNAQDSEALGSNEHQGVDTNSSGNKDELPLRDPVAAAAGLPTSASKAYADVFFGSNPGSVSGRGTGPAAVATAAGGDAEEAEEKVESGGGVPSRVPLVEAEEPAPSNPPPGKVGEAEDEASAPLAMAATAASAVSAAWDRGDEPPKPPPRRM